MNQNNIIRKRILIFGIVQGVGFRPYVYKTSLKHENITGFVLNQGSHVLLELQGTESDINKFLMEVLKNPPQHSRIDNVNTENIPIIKLETNFSIKYSETIFQNEKILISPDIAMCKNCEKEMFNPKNRRYKYPFINCTDCGPRFSIISKTPYDRQNTTMVDFKMCEACIKEYSDPLNRRFHAEPISCTFCTPTLKFTSKNFTDTSNPIEYASDLLKSGKILAIKGIGGYHLACNARNYLAVETLRERKNRDKRPFAIMANIEKIKEVAIVDENEERILCSSKAPIVILKSKNLLPKNISPDNTIGAMIPYSPLHKLLLDDNLDILIMTSGNPSGEPIVYEDEKAEMYLKHMADGILSHNRKIYSPIEDSVVQVYDKKEYFIRRSRGYVPKPVSFNISKNIAPAVFAMGGDIKNTFCIGDSNQFFLSQHIGNMENPESEKAFYHILDLFKKLLKKKVDVIACDKHKAYFTHKIGTKLASSENIPLIEIWHHRAHLASAMADNNLSSPVIGVIFDGTGFGEDGRVWGGEVFIGDLNSQKRVCHLEYVDIQNNNSMIFEPRKVFLSFVNKVLLQKQEDLILKGLIEKKINTFACSSAGRFFDAAAYAAGIGNLCTYEAEVAVKLESYGRKFTGNTCTYEVDTFVDENNVTIFKTKNIIDSIVKDKNDIKIEEIACKFHKTLAEIILKSCIYAREISDISDVCLSGGVFQNLLLLKESKKNLENAGFKVFIHRQIPANDGGISLGQAVIALESIN